MIRFLVNLVVGCCDSSLSLADT